MSASAWQVPTVDRLVAVINSGDDGAEATRQHHAILAAINENQREFGGKHKAKLLLEIGYEGDAKGVDISLKVTAKLPLRPVLRERYYLTRDNVLTLQDPARDTLFAGDDLGRARPKPNEAAS
jgi:hypothetical protein